MIPSGCPDFSQTNLVWLISVAYILGYTSRIALAIWVSLTDLYRRREVLTGFTFGAYELWMPCATIIHLYVCIHLNTSLSDPFINSYVFSSLQNQILPMYIQCLQMSFGKWHNMGSFQWDCLGNPFCKCHVIYEPVVTNEGIWHEQFSLSSSLITRQGHSGVTSSGPNSCIQIYLWS